MIQGPSDVDSMDWLELGLGVIACCFVCCGVGDVIGARCITLVFFGAFLFGAPLFNIFHFSHKKK